MNKTIALIAAACIATPALAWGDREQGALAGILGTLIFQNIQRDAQAQQPPVVTPQPQIIYQPQPQVIYAPPPPPRPVCEHHPVYDHYGYHRGWRTICR
jgi:hypothetical protein